MNEGKRVAANTAKKTVRKVSVAPVTYVLTSTLLDPLYAHWWQKGNMILILDMFASVPLEESWWQNVCWSHQQNGQLV
jgi:hypothetical protein